MAAKKARKAPGPSAIPPTPTIHKATQGNLGKVVRGDEITEAEAVARRRVGQDVVVCGGSTEANRAVARRIESAVGPCKRSGPHESLGPYALPHYQPEPRPPEGHSFYETDRRKAAKNP